MDVSSWLELCGQVPNLTIDQFWRSTPFEITSAHVGYQKANGLGRWQIRENGWSDEGLEDFKTEVAEAMKRFPDKPAKGKANGR